MLFWSTFMNFFAGKDNFFRGHILTLPNYFTFCLRIQKKSRIFAADLKV